MDMQREDKRMTSFDGQQNIEERGRERERTTEEEMDGLYQGGWS